MVTLLLLDAELEEEDLLVGVCVEVEGVAAEEDLLEEDELEEDLDTVEEDRVEEELDLVALEEELLLA